jgi:hypothetical protein
MVTGRRAFERPTKPETLAAIIREDPEPIATLNPRVPAPLRWIVERCHAKEAKSRYASTDDLARDLTLLREHLSEVGGLAFGPEAARRGAAWSVGSSQGRASSPLVSSETSPRAAAANRPSLRDSAN